MPNHHVQSNLFTTPPSSQFEPSIPRQVPIQQLSESGINSLIQTALIPPKARVTWKGQIQSSLDGKVSHAFKQVLEQMKAYPDVLVVDFNWTNFATFFNHDSWGMIGNLHPHNCVKDRRQNLQQLLLQPYNTAQRTILEQALTINALNSYRLSIRNAMLEKLVEVAKDYRVVVTETLDVETLHQAACKQTVIKDLGWLNLLEDFKGLLEDQGTELVLLERMYKSLTCPNCQHSSRENRNGNSFYCLRCGFGGLPDFMAGMNMWTDWLSRAKTNQF